ncbi:MAG: DUF423 domain-containing protein [Planctomycetota bacterium]
MSPRQILIGAGVVGLTGVLAGAFGAHGLASRGVSAEALGWWETGARYQLGHAAVLLGCGVWAARTDRGAGAQRRLLGVAAWAFLLGVAVFAGTLYAMTLGAPRWLGAVTPVGGLSLMVGWGLLAAAGWWERKAERGATDNDAGS